MDAYTASSMNFSEIFSQDTRYGHIHRDQIKLNDRHELNNRRSINNEEDE